MQKLHNWVDKTSGALKQKLDEKLTRFVVTTGIPFSVIDSSVFKEMLELMRPSYTPPSAGVVSQLCSKKSMMQIWRK
jgi:hypothetical protein